jgi:hypothetical protein
MKNICTTKLYEIYNFSIKFISVQVHMKCYDDLKMCWSLKRNSFNSLDLNIASIIWIRNDFT